MGNFWFKTRQNIVRFFTKHIQHIGEGETLNGISLYLYRLLFPVLNYINNYSDLKYDIMSDMFTINDIKILGHVLRDIKKLETDKKYNVTVFIEEDLVDSSKFLKITII